MATYISQETEKSIIELLNSYEWKYDVSIYDSEYKRLDFTLWNPDLVNIILDKLKCKDVGSTINYPYYIDQPVSFQGLDFVYNFNKYQRINISEKYNCVLVYTSTKYSSYVTILTTLKKMKKILKHIKPIIDSDEKIDMFKDIDFNCKKNEYIDITYKGYDEDKNTDTNTIKAIKRTIDSEKLVFDPESELFNVMSDIHTFFEKETKDVYKKMDILYKRGVIIYGPPGNGKSAMIREMIRQLSGINKIVVTSNAGNITNVLSALFKKLDNQKSIVIIEDIDSLIDKYNRSEFLNLLDGISVKSGIYFIGSTNYLERVDPAFINRSGRFDRTYKIDNPSDTLRREYFRSKNISELLSEFKVHAKDSENRDLSVIDLFVKYSDGLSMANLKELMITTQYTLASKKFKSIEEALINANKILVEASKFASDQLEKRRSFNSHRFMPEEY